MSHRTIALMAVLPMLLAASPPAEAQVEGMGALKGRVYFDLQKGMSDSNEDVLTYRFRRLYFGYDMQISEEVKGRFLVDAGQDPGGGHSVFLKHAYAEWQAANGFTLRVGQQGTIMYSEIEGIWGYRSIAKTFQDNFGIRSSSDLGISGAFSVSDLVGVKAMMSNGNGFNRKDDNAYGKAYEFKGLITPFEGLLVSAFFGMNGFDPDGDPDTDDMENAVTMDLSVGYQGEGYAAGGSLTTQSNHGFSSGSDGLGFCAFGKYSITDSPFGLLARYDSWDPDTGVDDNTETLMILGLDYSAAEGLHIIPNIQHVKQAGRDAVNTFLLTFYWEW